MRARCSSCSYTLLNFSSVVFFSLAFGYVSGRQADRKAKEAMREIQMGAAAARIEKFE
jgi:hypothetical protein